MSAMPEAETIVDTKEQYRDHYIRIRATATPPLPHDDDEDGTIAAHVKVYDGQPGDMGMLNPGGKLAGDVVDSWSEEVPLFDSEDAIGDLLKKAKDRVDTRVGQRYGVRESVVTAIERELKNDAKGEADESATHE
jgi:hypothetical protein